MRISWTSLGLVVLVAAGCGDDTTAPSGGDGTTGDVAATTGGTTGPAVVGPGAPPDAPVLSSPMNLAVDVGDMADTGVTAELCWEPVVDPDGDPVRYRVWVDEIELTEGKLETEPGWPGPCFGPLNFNFAQTYSWRVSAFNPDFPIEDAEGNRTGWESESEPSDTWLFTTASNGASVVLFEDDFEDDLGWTASGDANDGHWVLGDPTPAEFEGEVSQPAECAGQDGCYFTGVNMDGLPNIADVRGGTTVLTSPPIDMSEVTTATVQLSRFFFKSEFPETGTLFKVEVVIPDDEAPTGERAFVLEQLELQGESASANSWTPREYSACGVPMHEAARLRVTATDLGEGILEAAIDNVVVTGYFDASLCDGGLDSVCDPNAEDACSGDLLCCGVGVVNKGVYRCSNPVPSLSFPNAGTLPGEPGNGPMGCDAPDLFATTMGMNVWEDDQFIPTDSCTIFEGCVDAPGNRRLLRFDTVTPNAGSRDLVMGVPTNHPDLFVWSECHGHYHFDGYSVYELLDGEEVVARGHKQAFCLLDWEPWAYPNDDNVYTCSNQGISAGWQDVYGGTLECNWVDITDVAPGDYTLRISINPPRDDTAVSPLIERDYSNNVLDVPVTITGE
ncbi:MAG: lysyl oxidase family protein [Myxococcota bacterium]